MVIRFPNIVYISREDGVFFALDCRVGGLMQPISHGYDDLALGWDLWWYLWFTPISARSKSVLERS
jgi:hypothetical protein